MTEAPAAVPPPGWRPIDELARLVGAYCWLEHRVFEVTGTWGARPVGRSGDAALVVWCAAASRRHADLARAWADRLPARAGVDRVALVAAPDPVLASALEAIEAFPDLEGGFGVLVGSVLPRVHRAYGAHLGTAAAVSEAPVMEVLARATRELDGEIHDGHRLLGQPQGGAGAGDERARDLGTTFERSFDSAGVFPAVRPS